MPNKYGLSVRKVAITDKRAQRTTHALVRALLELIQEGGGRFEDITVREILERAGVGRTTFYSHFRSKEDVLHSSYEGLFSIYKSLVEQESDTTSRLFPVREFVEQVAQVKATMAALRRAGLAEDMKSQFIGYAADIIEGRIRYLELVTSVRPRLAARMLAAALIESIDWWIDRDYVVAAEIDAAFHLLARALTARGRSQRGADSGWRDSDSSLVTKR